MNKYQRAACIDRAELEHKEFIETMEYLIHLLRDLSTFNEGLKSNHEILIDQIDDFLTSASVELECLAGLCEGL